MFDLCMSMPDLYWRLLTLNIEQVWNKVYVAKAYRITILSITTFSITDPIVILSKNDIRHLHWETLCWVSNLLIVILNVVMLCVIMLSAPFSYCHTECCYAVCYYAECRGTRPRPLLKYYLLIFLWYWLPFKAFIQSMDVWKLFKH